MVKIAICDDDPKALKRMKALIIEPAAEIYTFCSGKEFLTSSTHFDIVLLDIEIPDIDGMKIASELMKRNQDCLLLFITAFGQYSTKGYEFRAFRYVLKTEPDSFIQRNIQDAIDEYYARTVFLETCYKKEIAKVPLRDIIYIEVLRHVINIYTSYTTYYWSCTLEKVKDLLQKYYFVQCHKSFLVNLKYIHSIEKGVCIHLSGKTVPIGRKYNANVINSYLEYSDRRI